MKSTASEPGLNVVGLGVVGRGRGLWVVGVGVCVKEV